MCSIYHIIEFGPKVIKKYNLYSLWFVDIDILEIVVPFSRIDYIKSYLMTPKWTLTTELWVHTLLMRFCMCVFAVQDYMDKTLSAVNTTLAGHVQKHIKCL